MHFVVSLPHTGFNRWKTNAHWFLTGIQQRHAFSIYANFSMTGFTAFILSLIFLCRCNQKKHRKSSHQKEMKVSFKARMSEISQAIKLGDTWNVLPLPDTLSCYRREHNLSFSWVFKYQTCTGRWFEAFGELSLIAGPNQTQVCPFYYVMPRT